MESRVCQTVCQTVMLSGRDRLEGGMHEKHCGKQRNVLGLKGNIGLG